VYNTPEYGGERKAKFSHEIVGGAAAFEAMHMWEKKQRAEGRPVSHPLAREALAALAAAEADKLFEKKGLNFVDRERAKHHARHQIQELYDRHYASQDSYDP